MKNWKKLVGWISSITLVMSVAVGGIIYSTLVGSKLTKPSKIDLSWSGSEEKKLPGTINRDGNYQYGHLICNIDGEGDVDKNFTYHFDVLENVNVKFSVNDDGIISWSKLPSDPNLIIHFDVYAYSVNYPDVKSETLSFILNLHKPSPTTFDLKWPEKGVHKISGFVHQAGVYEAQALETEILPADADQSSTINILSGSESETGIVKIVEKNGKKYVGWNAVNSSVKKVVTFQVVATHTDSGMTDKEYFQLTLDLPQPQSIQINYSGTSTSLTGSINKAGSDTNRLTLVSSPSYAKQPVADSIRWSVMGDAASFIHVNNGVISWDSHSYIQNYSFTIKAECDEFNLQATKTFTLSLNYQQPSGIEWTWNKPSSEGYIFDLPVNTEKTSEGYCTGAIKNAADCSPDLHVEFIIQSNTSNIKDYVELTSDNKLKFKSRPTEGRVDFWIVARIKEMPEIRAANTVSFVYKTHYEQPTGISISWDGTTPITTKGFINKSGKSTNKFSYQIQGSNYSPNLEVEYIVTNYSDWISVDSDGYINWKAHSAVGTYSFSVSAKIKDTDIISEQKNVTLVIAYNPIQNITLSYPGEKNFTITEGESGTTTQALSYQINPTDVDPAITTTYEIKNLNISKQINITADGKISWPAIYASDLGDNSAVEFDVIAKASSVESNSLHFTLSMQGATASSVDLTYNGATTINADYSKTGSLDKPFTLGVTPSYAIGERKFVVTASSSLATANVSINQTTGILSWDATNITSATTGTITVVGKCGDVSSSPKTITLNLKQPLPESITCEWNGASQIEGYIHRNGQASGVNIKVNSQYADQGFQTRFWDVDSNRVVSNVSLAVSGNNLTWSCNENQQLTLRFKIQAKPTATGSTVDWASSSVITLVLKKPNVDPNLDDVEFNSISTSLSGKVREAGTSTQAISLITPSYTETVSDVVYSVKELRINGVLTSSDLVFVNQSRQIQWKSYMDSIDETIVTFKINATSASTGINIDSDTFTLTLAALTPTSLSIDYDGETNLTGVVGTEGSSDVLSASFDPIDIPTDYSDLTWSISQSGSVVEFDSAQRKIKWPGTSKCDNYEFTVNVTSRKYGISASKRFSLTIQEKQTTIKINWTGEKIIYAQKDVEGEYLVPFSVQTEGASSDESKKVNWYLESDTEGLFNIGLSSGVLTWAAYNSIAEKTIKIIAKSAVDESITDTLILKVSFFDGTEQIVSSYTEEISVNGDPGANAQIHRFNEPWAEDIVHYTMTLTPQNIIFDVDSELYVEMTWVGILIENGHENKTVDLTWTKNGKDGTLLIDEYVNITYNHNSLTDVITIDVSFVNPIDPEIRKQEGSEWWSDSRVYSAHFKFTFGISSSNVIYKILNPSKQVFSIEKDIEVTC